MFLNLWLQTDSNSTELVESLQSGVLSPPMLSDISINQVEVIHLYKSFFLKHTQTQSSRGGPTQQAGFSQFAPGSWWSWTGPRPGQPMAREIPEARSVAEVFFEKKNRMVKESIGCG